MDTQKDNILWKSVTEVTARQRQSLASRTLSYLMEKVKEFGHGVGLYVHEPPFLGANGEYKLALCNIITVEPGIYIPGWGGVRIEDQVLITECGCENLISATKELIEI